MNTFTPLGGASRLGAGQQRKSGRRSLIVVSNRLPISVSADENEIVTEESTGGLVSALSGVREAYQWVGWPGSFIAPELEDAVTQKLAPGHHTPVFLSTDEERDFYGQICNDTLWPLFHYFPARQSFSEEAWAHYKAVNERFADVIADIAEPNAAVWVHDYHLALVPEALRRRRPDLVIGFFLHIPFPSSEIYRLLPTRAELLRGILGADHVGFHSGDYARHFRSACLRVLGRESDPDSIEYDNRTVTIGIHPVGIDVDMFRNAMADIDAIPVSASIADRYRGKRLVLGVERLDYTKGIPQKLEAFERFLEADPSRAADTTMLQILVPSRLQSAEYRALRDEIEAKIAHINGRFGQPGRTPIEYLHRSVSLHELIALYRRADVLMVTPLRDGMNLVAQEFVLCQSLAADRAGSWRGVLLLSEFAGAAYVLPGALIVNPWDARDLVNRLTEALELDPVERRRRLELMAARVEQNDSHRWAEGFLDRLRRSKRKPRAQSPQALDEQTREKLVERFKGAHERTLLLDYDGTLRELVEHPELAAPTTEIRDLLLQLTALPNTSVHIVSGRKVETLDAWFDGLPLNLCAEHGYFVRERGERWHPAFELDLSWLKSVEHIFNRVAADVPGTLVERKTASVAWHYAQAEPEYGSWRARELLVTLEASLAGIPAEVLRGHRVIEVRARGVNKGSYVERVFPSGRKPSHFVLAAGDDLTDLDLFRALPAGSLAVHVGATALPVGSTRPEQYAVESPRALRQFLGSLAEGV